MTDRLMRHGGCHCGRVRLTMTGEPVRVGICHCATCRRETGGPFMAFAVWPSERVAITGEAASWTATTDHRHHCPACGATLYATTDGGEVEVRLGALDAAPSGLTPSYELWVGRREPWLAPLPGAAQHAGNRPPG